MENQKNNLHALKADWRRKLKNIRQQLPLNRRLEAAQTAYSVLYEKTNSFSSILSFASFGSEIDLWSLNRQLCVEGKLVLPRAQNNVLKLYRVTDIQNLESNSIGILQPKNDDSFLIDFTNIDLALIPGLGFDLQTKHRLGYGWGYYDRLLVNNEYATTFGIGFLEQSVKELPYHSLDISLEEIYLF